MNQEYTTIKGHTEFQYSPTHTHLVINFNHSKEGEISGYLKCNNCGLSEKFKYPAFNEFNMRNLKTEKEIKTIKRSFMSLHKNSDACKKSQPKRDRVFK